MNTPIEIQVCRIINHARRCASGVTTYGPVSVSVCLSHVGVLSKRMGGSSSTKMDAHSRMAVSLSQRSSSSVFSTIRRAGLSATVDSCFASSLRVT